MRKLFYILNYTLLLFPSFLFGQKYLIDVKHFNVDDGLSHRNVHVSLQDQRGYMWFGTDYGLNRFDGYTFKWITKEKHGLQENKLEKFFADSEGLFWLMYGNTKVYSDRNPVVSGIDIFNPKTEKVLPFEVYFKEKKNLLPKNILNFSQNAKGELIFITKNLQLITYTQNKTFEEVQLQNQYYAIKGFHWSENGYFWMNARRENDKKSQMFIIAINEKGQEVFAIPLAEQFGRVFFYSSPNNLNEKWISLISTHENKNYQFGEITPQGKIIPNTDEPLFRKLNINFQHFGKIAGYHDLGNKAWLFSDNGFFLLDKKLEKLYPLIDHQKNIGFVYHIFSDQYDKTWVSTQFGVHLIELKSNNFTNILKNDTGLFPVRGLVLDDQNALWVVKENMNNLLKISLSSNNKNILNIDIANSVENGERLTFSGLYYAIRKAKGGKIIYSPGHEYLVQFNPENYEYQIFRSVDTTLYKGHTWSIFMDTQEKIWRGTEKGIIGHLEKDSIQHFRLLEDSNKDFTIYQFIEADKNLWIVTEAGLFLLEKSTKKVLERFWAGGEGRFKLPFDKLYHAYQESEHQFWLGTSGTGLIYFDTKTGDFQQFTKADGLSDNTIYAVYSDREKNNLWLASNYGIMRFNKLTGQVNSYLTKDGISHNEFNRISHHQAKDGTLFFGGLNGVTAFHPRDFQSENLASITPLTISNFQQYVGKENQLIDKTAELLTQNKIILSPNDPFFRLEFALLTYNAPDKIQYAYKVEGLDKDWNYQKENYVRISRLPYGNHYLRIKGQSSNGQWSENELSINVEVLKPFYLENWFLILSAFLIAKSVFVVYKMRTAQLKMQKLQLEKEVEKRTKTIQKQAEELKSLEKLKSRFFANVSHELRTPLTLMLGPLQKLKKGNIPHKTAQRLLDFVQNNSTHLLKLVNEILDLSKLETGRLEVNETPVNLQDFLHPIYSQFSSYGDSESVILKFDYLANENLCLFIDKGKFEKIIHNFLSNALKFTPIGGEVRLAVIEKENHILIKVSDTGSGIHSEDLPHIFNRFYQSKQTDAPVQGGTGIGLSLCKELADLLGGRVWAESEFGVGSVFYFEFPKRVASSDFREDVPAQDVQLADIFEKEILENKKNESIKENTALLINSQQKQTILIVEDNPELREYLTVLLNDNYNILTAENGKEGYEKLLQTANCQLIISDLMMPVMNGFQFLEKVKSKDKFRHLPVIMLTARADVRVKLRALRIGVDDYLTKPFVEEELKIRVENLLRNYEVRIAAHFEKEEKHSENVAPVVAAADMEWLAEVEKIYWEFINDSRLNIDFVAEKMFLSGRQFHRKLKQITGLTPNHYLLEIRLTQALELIQNKKYYTIKETCHAVGFSDVKYFSKIFRKRFGMNPSEAIKQ